MPRRKTTRSDPRSAGCCTTYDDSALLVQLFLRADEREEQEAKAAEILEQSHLHASIQAALDKGCPESCPDYQIMQELAKIIAPVDAGSPLANVHSPTQWSPPNVTTLRRSPRLPEKRSEVGGEPQSKRQRGTGNNFAKNSLTSLPKSSTEDDGTDVGDAMEAAYPIVKDLFDNMQETGDPLDWPLVLKLFKLALSRRTEQHLAEFGDVLRELARDLPDLLPVIEECCGKAAEVQDDESQREEVDESESVVASKKTSAAKIPKPKPRKEPDSEEDSEEVKESLAEEELEARSREAEKARSLPPLLTPPRTPPIALELPPSPPPLPTGPIYKRSKADYYLPAFYKQNHTTYFHYTNQLSTEDLKQVLEHGFVQVDDVVMSWTGDLPRPTAHLDCWDEAEAAALARFMERQVREMSPVDPGEAFDSALRQLVAMRGADPTEVAAKVRKVRRLAEGNALLTDLAEGKLMYYENSTELEAALEEEAATAKKTKKRLPSWVSEHKTLFERAQKYPRLFAICISIGYIMKYTLVMLAVCDKYPEAFGYDDQLLYDDDLGACPPLLQEVLRKE